MLFTLLNVVLKMSRFNKQLLSSFNNVTIRLLSRQISDINPKLCIVGGGPAGFYAAQHLVKIIPNAKVDIYERLPVPFGLVRFGVAPDHLEVKNVINTFTKTANHPGVSFFGNLSLGKEFSLADLRNAYHAVILSYGAEEDRRLNIEGENLKNVIPARRFVGWYNGLPSDKDLNVDLQCDSVAVIGQGNVAVDVARILLSSVDKLKETDITEYSLEKLSQSRVREVHLIGRRGPMQVAFTIKELREMLQLPGVQSVFCKDDFGGIPELIPNLGRPRKRLTELLCKAALEDNPSCNKTLHFTFLRTPLSVEGSDKIEKLNLAVNKLEGSDWSNQKAVASDLTTSQNCGLLLRSIGYKSVQADGSLPFDANSGVAVNSNGYISDGLYCCGWLSTGPTGVILSTMSNAFATAQLIQKHIAEGKLDCSMTKPGSEVIIDSAEKQGTQVVTFKNWEKIDAEEQRRGALRGKPREKIVDVQEMLAVAAS